MYKHPSPHLFLYLQVPIVIVKTKDMRNSTNIFLTNLSIADLLVLLVCTPTVLVEVNTRPETWVLGHEMCEWQSERRTQLTFCQQLQNCLSHSHIPLFLSLFSSPRQSGALRWADGSPCKRFNHIGHLVWALLRHLWAIKGRLCLHQGACDTHLRPGLGHRSALYEVSGIAQLLLHLCLSRLLTLLLSFSRSISLSVDGSMNSSLILVCVSSFLECLQIKYCALRCIVVSVICNL